MNKITKLLLLGSASLALAGCNDDDVKVVETEVIVEQVVTVVETVEVPVVVPVVGGAGSNTQVGSRPYFLIEDMDQGPLKTALQQCSEGPFYKTDFSIGHRGAAMQYPEHTKESYTAAVRMGAGIVECDVTFTQDKELVCRHSQCDLHTTTNILAIPELAAKCTTPFTPADAATGTLAQAQCCTSDITLAEFRLLEGKMDASDPTATTVEQYLKGTPDFRTDAYSSHATLLTHAESIDLLKSLGAKMTPELKVPAVTMPYDGFTQEDFAQKLINEYKAAEVPPSDVFVQSFLLSDVKYWIANEPTFGEQAVYLDEQYNNPDFDPENSATWSPSMAELVADGVKIISPALWVLVGLDDDNKIVPSAFAIEAKAAGLDIVTWTLERSGPLASGGGWYYQSIADAINNDGDQFALLDVLAKDVGVIGVFADWPGTVSYYASCMNMPASL